MRGEFDPRRQEVAALRMWWTVITGCAVFWAALAWWLL